MSDGIAMEIGAALEGLGARLREVRERSGLSQREMAARLRISASYLSAVERGDDAPNARVVIGVAHMVGPANLAWLFTGKSADAENAPSEISFPVAVSRNTIGGRVRAVRQSLGLSQTELGEKLEVSRSCVCEVETGAAKPGVEFLVGLTRLAPTRSLTWLVTGEGENGGDGLSSEARDALAHAVAEVNRVVAEISSSNTRVRGWCRFDDDTPGFRLEVEVTTGREVFR